MIQKFYTIEGPQYETFTIRTTKAFIHKVVAELCPEAKSSRERWLYGDWLPWFGPSEGVLQRYYNHGKQEKLLACDYDQFITAIGWLRSNRGYSYYRGPYPFDGRDYKPMRSKWWKPDPKDSSYIKKPHHKKKVLSEEEVQKREWREKVKRGKGANYYRRGAGYYKQVDAKARRRYTKSMITAGQYDKAMECDNKNTFVNSYDWY